MPPTAPMVFLPASAAIARGEVADEVAGLLRLEGQALDVRDRACPPCRRTARLDREVGDRELRVRELLRRRVGRVGEQEAGGDDEVGLRPRRPRSCSGCSRSTEFDCLASAVIAEVRLRLVEAGELASWLKPRSLKLPMSVMSATVDRVGLRCRRRRPASSRAIASDERRARRPPQTKVVFSRTLLRFDVLHRVLTPSSRYAGDAKPLDAREAKIDGASERARSRRARRAARARARRRARGAASSPRSRR